MLNDIADIKLTWPPEALDLNNTQVIQDNKTAYVLFLEKQAAAVGRRLRSWVGDEAYDDASSATPADTCRADALKEAEIDLIHVCCMEKLWRDKSAGVERDIQLPSGKRITLNTFNSDEYATIIQAHITNAERVVMEYLV